MITFQVEKFDNVKEEVYEIGKEHHEEVDVDKDIIKLNPSFEGYQALSDNNMLTVITAKKDNRIVGYSFFITQKSLPFQQVIMAINCLFYVKKEHRGGGAGNGLIKKAEEVFTKAGIHQIFMTTKPHASFAPLLERNNYEEFEVVYKKTINIPE